jgi:hypothetical protein
MATLGLYIIRTKGMRKDTHHTRSFPLPPLTKTGGAGGAPVGSVVEDELAVGVAVLVSVNCSVVPTAVGLASSAVDADAEGVDDTDGESIIEGSAEDDSDAVEVESSGPVDEVPGCTVITVAVVIVVAVVVVMVKDVSNVKVGTAMELETRTEVAGDGEAVETPTDGGRELKAVLGGSGKAGGISVVLHGDGDGELRIG